MTEQEQRTQLRKTYQSFKEPKTRMQVARELGIDRGNICWLVDDLFESGNIAVVKVDRCPITNYKAQFLTTDSDLIKEQRQKEPTLFE